MKKSKQLLVVSTIVAVVVLMAIMARAHGVITSNPIYDASALSEETNITEYVWHDIAFKNVSHFVIEQEEDFLQFTENELSGLTPQKAGAFDLQVVDTEGGEHTLHIQVTPVSIRLCGVEIKGQTGFYYNGKEQPLEFYGEYLGHEVTFEAVYQDLIGPEINNKVTIIGTGNFTGEKELRYSIRLKKTTFLSVEHIAKDALKVNLKSLGGDYCYQLQARKNGGAWGNYDLKSSTSKTFKNLKLKDKYQFRVRTYVTVNGKNKFGSGEWITHTGSETVGLSLKNCKVTGIVNKVYNGKPQTQSFKVTYNGKPVKVIANYGDNKNIGKRYITLTGTGNFTDSIKVYYYIVPQAPKITGLMEYYSDETDSFSEADISCTIPAGGITSYQYAVQEKGSSEWIYFDSGFRYKTFTLKGLKPGTIYTVKARACKSFGSDYCVYSKWSAAERVYVCEKEMANDYFYYTKDTITGYVTGAIKGDQIRVVAGGKTFKVICSKDAKIYKFKIKIGKQKLGSKITLQYLNKFGEKRIEYKTLVYYADQVKKGFTKSQVKLVPGYEKTYSTYKEGNNECWEYLWAEDENTGIYGLLTFDKSGKLIKQEYYKVQL